jgi:hypothetical protein
VTIVKYIMKAVMQSAKIDARVQIVKSILLMVNVICGTYSFLCVFIESINLINQYILDPCKLYI